VSSGQRQLVSQRRKLPENLAEILALPETTAEEIRARRAHSSVEKQYRNRLNAQFERLLAVLPRSNIGDEDVETQDPEGERRLGKAEVLRMAAKHIEMLDGDRKVLEKERKELTRNVENLRGLLLLSSNASSSGAGQSSRA
jgi:hypothetical protein